MKFGIAVLVIWMAGFLPVAARGQTAAPAPPSSVIAVDHDWDDGTRIDLSWTLSPGDSALQGYLIRRKAAGDAAFSRVEMVAPGANHFTVSDLTLGKPYFFQVTAVSKELTESSPAATSDARRADHAMVRWHLGFGSW